LSLTDALLLDPATFDVWISTRTDALASGALNDPFWGGDETKFDAVMNSLASRTNIRIHLSDGAFRTRGYADGVSAGWQIKPGWKIVGAGMDATVLKIVGAASGGHQFFAIGHALDDGGSPAVVTAVDFAEICDLTIDCNVDWQSSTNVACGGIRILGQHCMIRRVKVINWGNKINPTDTTDANPFGVLMALTGVATPDLYEVFGTGMQDCVAAEPSPNSWRDVNVFYLGALGDHGTTHVQPYGRSPFIRNCAVDCNFKRGSALAPSYSSSAILTAASVSYSGGTGTFVGKRPHGRKTGEYVRIQNPNDPTSRWKGYFQITEDAGNPSDPTKFTFLMSDPGSDDHTLVTCGVEFRAIVAGSAQGAVVERNQIQNTWIGGPYQEILNTKEIIIRHNSYKNVAAGPSIRAGALGGMRGSVAFSYNTSAQKVTGSTTSVHNFFAGQWIYVTAAGNYNGFRQITAVTDTTFDFSYGATAGTSPGTVQQLWGVDKALIDDNVIELMDLDTTEFAPRDLYPQTSSRATAILFSDTPGNIPLSPAPSYVHGDVIIRSNRIGYLDCNMIFSSTGGALAGIGVQVAGAKNFIVMDNIVEVIPANPLLNYRCGNVTYFNNKTPLGILIQGFRGDDSTKYTELETEAEDALVLTFI